MKEKIYTEAYIIRHGQPRYPLNKEGEKLMYGPETRLSETGIKQSEELAVRIPSLEAIYSSPFIRTMETANIIINTKKLDLKIIEEPNLIDIVSRGAIGLLLDKLSIGEIVSISPGDETLEDLERRVLPTFSKIFDKERGKTFAVVSSGHCIRLWALRILEKNKSELSSISIDKLQSYNYLNPGEAWYVKWDENNQVVDYKIMARRDTITPGRRQDVKFNVVY